MPKRGWKKNPETGAYEPPAEGAVEAVEAAPRRRHDPDDAPVDGDYRNDRVLNKRPGYRYYLLDEDDAVIKYAQGATKVERSKDGPRPMFARGSDADSGYTVRGLTLFEMPEKLAQRMDARATSEAQQRMAIVRQEARTSVGGEYSETAV